MSSAWVMKGMIGFYVLLFFAYLFGPPRNCGAASEPADSMNTMVQPDAIPGLA